MIDRSLLHRHAESLAAALADLDDGEPCWLDHNGNCQAHSVTNPCEMATARQALADWRAIKDSSDAQR